MAHFGEHVTYDGYGADPGILDCRAAVHGVLADLAAKLGMTVLAGPVVYLAEATNAKDPGGWTGMVVLQESHISVHTFPARGFVSADVYTCQNGLDTEAVRQFLRKRFAASDDEVHHLKRGTRYPTLDLHPERVRHAGRDRG
ncbi:MAG: adenosylmethionine decarboxylase [Acidimicrobiales bacterium]